MTHVAAGSASRSEQPRACSKLVVLHDTLCATPCPHRPISPVRFGGTEPHRHHLASIDAALRPREYPSPRPETRRVSRII